MSLKLEVNKKCINEEKQIECILSDKCMAVWKKNKVDPNFIPYFEMINALNENVKL